MVRGGARFYGFLLAVIVIIAASAVSMRGGGIQEEWIASGDSRLFCRSLGEGPPLVVLHGGPGLTQDYLQPELDQLAVDRRIIFYDQRGCGRSTGVITAETMTVETMVADLEAIRRHFHHDRISILGHSWGGWLAMKYAIIHPNHVDRLILVSSAPASSEELARFLAELTRRLVPYEGVLHGLQTTTAFAEGDPATITEWYRTLFTPYFYRPEEVKLLHLPFTQTAAKNSFKVNELLVRDAWQRSFDLHPSLRAMAIPTLILHGKNDPIPIEGATSIHESIAGSRYKVIDHCGHFPYIEAPTAFFSSIHDFLQEK